MSPNSKTIGSFVMAFAWATGLVFAIDHYSGHDKATERECSTLAWRIANRSHSILESDAFRRTQGQAFRTCVADPEAFRRLVSRGS